MKTVDEKIIYKCLNCGYTNIQKKFYKSKRKYKQLISDWHECPQCSSQAIVGPDQYQFTPIKPRSPK